MPGPADPRLPAEPAVSCTESLHGTPAGIRGNPRAEPGPRRRHRAHRGARAGSAPAGRPGGPGRAGTGTLRAGPLGAGRPGDRPARARRFGCDAAGGSTVVVRAANHPEPARLPRTVGVRRGGPPADRWRGGPSADTSGLPAPFLLLGLGLLLTSASALGLRRNARTRAALREGADG
ncbi:hypothetical protein [Sinomonas atrocyanea]